MAMSGQRAGQTGVGDGEMVMMGVIGVLVALGAYVWLTGELAAFCAAGDAPHVSMTQLGQTLVALPRHLDDPGAAWPTGARELMPNPTGFYAAALLTAMVLLVPLA